MEISVVVPVYKCEPCLRHLLERLTAVLGALGSYEIVFVDDRSPDASWATLSELSSDPHVRTIRLSRNFGQHAAITAGLAAANGQRTVVMDCDLQDPPEVIPQLLAKAQEGFDVVFARRRRRRHSLTRRLASRLYFRLLNVFLATDIDGEYGTFSVISAKVRHAYLQLRDQDRHYLHILFWLGFDHTSVEYEVPDRYAGESAYNLRTLLVHAFDGIFFQTTTLLRWIIYFGFAVAGAGALWALYVLWVAVTASALPGYASLAVLILVVGGSILISTGVTGLYIGRIFRQVKERPLYVVDEDSGSSAQTSEYALAHASDSDDASA